MDVMKMMAQYLTYLCWLATTVLAQEAEDVDPDEKIKIAHAALASTVWVFVLPLGAVLLRLLSGRKAVAVHVCIQVFGVAALVGSAGLGIRMALDMGELSEYHCIIGLVLFAALFIQVAGGVIHHLLYRKHHQRTIVSHAHIWLGRALITLGMINGGLGLQLSDDAERGEYIAYAVVAGSIWLLWIGVDIGMSRVQRNGTSSSESSDEKVMQK